MLAASAYPYPFPPLHLQAGYQATHNAIQLSDVDRQREQQRKRTYLSLLPPAQIIEICLNFEQCVPLHLRSAVWPPDLDAAILALQKTSQTDTAKADPKLQQQPSPPADSTSTPSSGGFGNLASQQVHPPGAEANFVPPVQAAEASFPTPSPSVDKPVSSSPPPQPIITHALEEVPVVPSASQGEPEQTDVITEISSTLASAPTAPDAAPPQPDTQVTPTPQPPTSTTQAPEQPLQTDPPTPQAQTLPQTQTPASTAPGQTLLVAQPTASLVPGAYPYAPYGYQPYAPAGTTQQAAYPHTPYYAPPGAPTTGYTAHYPGYPAFTQPYAPPTIHQHGAPQPPPAPPPQGEDLPSYEDMIVEGLAEIGDPDGAAPKDIFAWIGARWPLQMNFRPSASQALQKAFKRGRLEKQAGGKYRLNPNWEGGATSRRTTRRPQTLAQTTYALHQAQQPASPFTHAPLPLRAQTSPPPPAPPPQHTPYPGYAYAYPGYPGYPGYAYSAQPAASTTASKTTTTVFKNILSGPPKTATKTIPSGKDKEPASDDAGDAWEAAQHILQAINFGSLQTNAQPAPDVNAASTNAAPPPVTATLDFTVDMDSSSSSSSAAAASLTLGEDGLGRATLTGEERASLQAQLALLAAQLSEIASGEDDDEDMQEASPATVVAPLQQQHTAHVPHVPITSPTAVLVHHPPPVQPILVDINQFPEETVQELLLQYPEESTAASTNVTDKAIGPSALPPPQPVGLSHPQQPVFLSPPPQSQPQPVQDPEPAPVGMEDESDEDDDMEMVDVDSFMQTLQG